ncbi:MAG: transcription antitermination factor NusB [Ezakiella sp.]|nr:transcription antitermination factor NusB [Ezakiella sp.]
MQRKSSKKINKNNREIAFDLLYRILIEDAFSNIALQKKVDNRPFITELVYGVIERKLTLNHIMMKYSKLKEDKIHDKAKILIYMALYELLYMKSEDYAVINEIVELAKKMLNTGAAGFINGILRSCQRDHVVLDEIDNSDFEIKYSIGSELLDMIKKSYRGKYIPILENAFQKSKVHIYIRKNRDGILNSLKSNKIGYKELEDFLILSKYDHNALADYFRRGEFAIMDHSTSSIRKLLKNILKVDSIIDLCAAPGGKTLLVADTFVDADITACDINETRVRLLKENIVRWGLKNVDVKVNDARLNDGNKYDLAICDVPCSGSGVLKRRPELKYKINYEMISELNKKQRAILQNAISQVDSGGYIIYSTCSILKNENEDIVSEYIDESVKIVDKTLVLPNEINEGYFACLLKKM